MIGITIRPATEQDASIIARCVFAAIELLDFDTDVPAEMITPLKKLEQATLDNSRLYSCHNSLIAEIEEEAVGCLISYNGDRYAAMRKRTFDILYDESGIDLRGNPMETCTGEYYLDCMAIKRKYRGKGIGHRLMVKAMENGKNMGIKRFTLLVEKSHKHLAEYYAKLGFTPMEELFAFGTEYVKMIFSTN